ncbi:c-type cytochrome [Aliiroseovarius crassostreae]|uniref:c-type cytochrome n=1 Tax=Aliiroseovarius crassostreae TaxID=154981 RepID=UPI003C7B61F3
MNRFTQVISATALVFAVTPALAHDDVKNPAVKARMMTMETIGGGMKVLAGMAKGEMEFDSAKAEAAMATIASEGMKVPALFEANETDPKSEALPAIWENWDDFVKKSEDMVMAAKANATLPDQGTLGASLGKVGGTCKACHDEYRKK